MEFNVLKKITNNWLQIGNDSIYVDVVLTGNKTIRIGSMPDILKLTGKYSINEDIVVVPDWIFSQGGDNRTGEEFNFWGYAASVKKPPLYIGINENIDQLYSNLKTIYPYYFEPTGRKIVETDWLERYFKSQYLNNENVFRSGNLEIRLLNDQVTISEGGNVLYKSIPSFEKSREYIEKFLAGLSTRFSKKNNEGDFEIKVIGNGNGFVGTTSSFLVKAGNYKIWIDPAAQPAFSLGRFGIHWDEVTHLLITHNHEDHISGFTACLKRAVENNKKIKLITAPGIYKVLVEQFRPLFSDIEKYIDLISVTPEKPLKLGELTIHARWNHHIIPYGTLGLKMKYRSCCWGFSGDNKYDEAIVSELKRDDLKPEWFDDCCLIFHEVDFSNPKTVHTYYEELLKFKQKVKGQLFVYHTDPGLVKAGFQIAQEGKSYILKEGGKIEII